MDRNYFIKYYYLERNNWWFLVRADTLKKIIKKYVHINKNELVVNIGAATGRTSEILSEFGNVTSIENDAACCAFLRNELNMEVIEASATSLPFEDNKFRLVCLFDVLEHIKEDGLAMNESYRVTAKGGAIIISVPAYNWMWSMHDDVNHHFRRYSKSQIAALLVKSGYKIKYITGFNFLLFIPIAFFRILSRLVMRKNHTSRSDFEISFFSKNNVFNKIFYKILSIEKYLIPDFRFPFGVSIIVVAEKN